MNGTNSERRSQVLLGLSRVVRDETEGNTSEAEKEWLRRICGGQPVTEQKASPAKEAEHILNILGLVRSSYHMAKADFSNI